MIKTHGADMTKLETKKLILLHDFLGKAGVNPLVYESLIDS